MATTYGRPDLGLEHPHIRHAHCTPAHGTPLARTPPPFPDPGTGHCLESSLGPGNLGNLRALKCPS